MIIQILLDYFNLLTMETILEKSLITNPEITVILINYNQENFLKVLFKVF